MPYLDITTGARLEYVEAGAGPPLIALHGMLGTARHHLGHVIDWLAADYRVIGPNLRGYGHSQPRPRHFPIGFYRQDAEDVLAFMDALGIEQAALIGYSDGGEIALLMAGLQPERFRAVAVWGAVGIYDQVMREVVTAPGYAARLAPTPTQMTQLGIFDGEAFAREWITAILHIIDHDGDVSYSLADRIRAPLLMMLGRNDTLNPATNAERYLARVPDGRLALFDCGHAVQDEAWDDFQREVGPFLAAAHGT